MSDESELLNGIKTELGFTRETIALNAKDNLLGALIDMEETGEADEACLNTIRRVLGQLGNVEKALRDV